MKIESSEVWQDIPGYPMCKVSSFGNVKIEKRIIQFQDKGPSYKYAIIQGKNFPVHGLILLSFVGPRPAGCVINHLDRNPSNNRLDNLEYISHKGNTAHWYNHLETYKEEQKKVRQS